MHSTAPFTPTTEYLSQMQHERNLQ